MQDRIRHESQSRADTMNVLQKETEKATNDLLFKLHNEIFKRIDSTSVSTESHRLSYVTHWKGLPN